MNFEESADKVLAIDSSRSRADVIADLKFTKSVEETINRIFDGEFLQGIPQPKNNNDKPRSNKAFVIIDSDDDEEDDTDLFDVAVRKPSPPRIDFSDKEEDFGSPSSRHSLDFLDDDLPEIDYEERDSHQSNAVNSTTRSQSEISNKDTSFDFDFDPPSAVTDDAIQLLSSAEDTKHNNDFSFSPTPTPQNDPFAFDYITKDDTSKATSSRSESISLLESDSEDSLPSMDNLFDKLMSQKRTRKPIEEEEEPPVDRKGKRRAFEFNLSPSPPSGSDSFSDTTTAGLTAKERKKLETEERKRVQAEERKRVAEEKKRLREEQKEEKKRLKEQKQLEKERLQLLEKENRLKNDRTQILKEIIVDMHPKFCESKPGVLIRSVLERKEATVKSVKHRNHHVSWRRQVRSEWDENTATFVPYDLPKIIDEPYILVYLEALDFVKHIKEETMDDYIDGIQCTSPNQQVFLLIEGLETYYSKKKNLERRHFEDRIRSTIEGSTTASASRKKIEQEIEEGPDRKTVEDCINYLQIIKSIMFVMTKDDEDTASWLDSLTTDLALRRYKLKNADSAHKVVKSGLHASDNYFKMLQEIQLCTPSVALSVMSEYPTLQSLHRAYEDKDKREGELLLADLEVERSALQTRDRKVNRVMSKKIYNVFNCTDPDQIIY